MRLVSGIVYLSLAQVFLLGTGYVIHAWLGRLLGPGSYGTYGVILSLTGVANLLVTFSIPQAISKYVSEEEEKAYAIARQGLRLQFAFSLLVAAIYFLSARLLSLALRDPRLVPYVRFASLIILPYGLYRAYLGFFSGLRNFGRQTALIGLYSTVKVLVAVVLVYPFGIYGALSGFMLGSSLTVLVAHWLAPRRGDSGEFQPWRMVRFAAPFALFSLLIYLLMNTDILLVKALLQDDVLVGYYTAATNVARVPYFVLSSLGLVLLPSVSEAVKKGHSEKLTYLVSQSLRVILMIVVPATVLAIAASAQVITLFYSEVYLPAVVPFSILVVAMSLLATYFLLANIASGAGKPMAPVLVSLVSLCVGAFMGFVLIPRALLLGAALSTLIASLVAASLGALSVYRQFGTFVRPLTFIRVLAAALPLVLVHYLPSTPLFLLGGSIFAGALYLSILVLTGEITPEDYHELRSLLPQA